MKKIRVLLDGIEKKHQMRDHVEIEKKYLVSDGIQADKLNDLLVEALRSQRVARKKGGKGADNHENAEAEPRYTVQPNKSAKRQVDTYFDTKDALLEKHHMTLRIRHKEGDAPTQNELTLKLPENGKLSTEKQATAKQDVQTRNEGDAPTQNELAPKLPENGEQNIEEQAAANQNVQTTR